MHPPSSTSCVNVRPNGLTVLHDPSEDEGIGCPIVDIILVHGLQGHPVRTWLYDAGATSVQVSTISLDGTLGENTSFRRGKRNSIRATLSSVFSRSKKSATTNDNSSSSILSQTSLGSDTTYWPRDLLPGDCPHARVMVWGYDTVVTKGYSPANRSNVFTHAKDLLYAIERSCPKGRNIIFVAHSLGGLLVKEMLRRSQHSEDGGLRRIIESTKGVVFLGTPHRGSPDFARLGDLIRKVASTVLRVDSNASILRALALDSPELELSRESFLQQWRTYEFQVKTFQECQAMVGMNFGVLNEKVVPNMSSSLDDPRERAETIQADHRNMTKYWGRDDPNYLKVSGELQRIIDLTVETVAAVDPQSLTQEERACLDTLAFSSMGDRKHNITEALSSTCRWFRDSQEFKRWLGRTNLSTDRGLLWVKGKPGAGKSTIMKNALSWIEDSESRRSNIASFFFNARGGSLEKTPLGLFRSILHQLCLQDAAILGQFVELHRARQRERERHFTGAQGREQVQWTRPELESFLRSIFGDCKPRRTFVFLDALDECDEETVRDVVYLLADIAQLALDRGISLNICLSSRHYPTISIPNCPEIVVEGSNKADISTYVHNRLRFIPTTEKKSVAELHSWLTDNASGVFLWAVLVVNILLQDIDAGEAISKIMERLKRVPKRMEDLYAELCSSLRPEERSFSISLIQWALFGKDDLLKDLHTTCLAARLSTHQDPASLGFNCLVKWGYDMNDIQNSQTDARLLRLIRNASRGLIEYTSNTVQFIHETVREFFLYGPGLQTLDARIMDQDSFQQSYSALVVGCINALELPVYFDTIRIMQTHSLDNIIPYATKVEQHGGSNILLLDTMQAYGSTLRRTLTRNGESILHFMSKNRITSSVLGCLDRGAKADDSGTLGESTTPLLAALGGIGGCRPPDTALIEGLVRHGADIERRDYQGNTPLMISINGGWLELVRYFLAQGSDIHCRNNWGLTPLGLTVNLILRPRSGTAEVDSQEMRCIESDYPALLLDFIGLGADVNAALPGGLTPLHLAIDACKPDLVEVLISGGARVGGEDETNPPLKHAARLAHPEGAFICQTLLANGADLEQADRPKGSLLLQAVRGGNVDTVQVLVDKGADVMVTDESGNSLLHHATALKGSTEASDMCWSLLQKGVWLHHRNHQSVTPFLAAVMHHNRAAIKFLVGQGANVDDFDINHWSAMHFLAKPLARESINRESVRKCAEELLQAGCSLSVRNLSGQTPLELATSFTFGLPSEVKEMLTEREKTEVRRITLTDNYIQ
ncbi:hypothetical protein QBC44DRAFT_375483 [Cladorrhinum sp. PSN332]|nr:hypothetical protein QBC44DRAFT_375483 [Cladorrhinum sp. PSN332]